MKGSTMPSAVGAQRAAPGMFFSFEFVLFFDEINIVLRLRMMFVFGKQLTQMATKDVAVKK